MSKVRFVGLDVHAETMAVAVAETGGEVSSLRVIPKGRRHKTIVCPTKSPHE
jgi:hypothetical protein